MKTQVKKIDQHKRELTVEVEGDIISKKFDQVYHRLNKQAKVPGFRSGNIPRDILEKQFSNVAHQEILKELLPGIYEQALKDSKLEPVSLPQISQINLEKNSLSFKANLEVKPKIDLKNYKHIPFEYKPIEVNQEEVAGALDRLRQNYAQMSDDDFAHSLGYPDLVTLTQALEKQIYLEKTKTQQINLENSIIEELLKQVNFQVPSSLINQQLDSLVKRAELDLVLRGMSKEDIEKQTPELRKNLQPQAEKQVRIFLVLEEVARRENVPRDEKMTKAVVEFLLRGLDWKTTKVS
jgi:FKBP-type peptidyl-prolyl cis-trans isomerase (trigger factor)